MSFTDYGNGMVMPVAPMFGGGYGMSGMGGFGNGFGYDGAWWIIVLLIAMGGRWFGNNGNGGSNDSILPYLLANNTSTNTISDAGLIQSGFNQAAITSALGDIQNNITAGFSNAEVSNCNRTITDLQTAYNNQIASMNQNFANQQALSSSLCGISSQIADCCCEERLATANLQSVIVSESAADRVATNNASRDIITSTNAGFQRILDKLCDQELQAERRENDNLRTQINMLNLAQSQANQTAAFIADNNAQTQTLIQRIAPYPQACYVVGNPNGCGCNNGYSAFSGYGNGCGWNNGFGAVGFGNGSF